MSASSNANQSSHSNHNNRDNAGAGGRDGGISIQQRNTAAHHHVAHGTSSSAGTSSFHHHEGGAGGSSTFKNAQRESAKLPGAASSSGMGIGQSMKRKQVAQESAGQGSSSQNMQNGANTVGLNQSAAGGGQPSNMGRKVGQKQMQGGASIVSPQKKGPGMGNERAPGATSAASKADMSLQNADGPVRAGAGSAANAEASLFNKHYNKELKLSEDEIPMVLCELNESAMAYLGRDQFDNALLLLQKAHGVLDVVDLSGSRRDQFIAFQLFHNMAMCYQKQGQLEECALCLETTLDHLGSDYASEKNQSLAVRIYKLKLEVRLRLQFCAILSQLHRHKEALEQAQEGIKIAHLIVRDKIAVCRFYSKRIDFQELYGHAGDDHQNDSSRGRDRSESQSRSEATASKPPSGTKGRQAERKHSARRKIGEYAGILEDQSKSSFPFDEDLQAGQLNGLKLVDELSTDSVGNYQTEQAILNNLDGSISLIEKTSKKLLPIYKALLNKISCIERQKDPLKKGTKELDERTNNDLSHNDFESSDESKIEGDKTGKSKKSPARLKSSSKGKKTSALKRGQQNVDLRHILGFLNQTEWIQNLNIGNIMQIGPLKLEDLTLMRRNEECLSRESFLEVISFLIVGCFCASTEIRFIIQLKDEIGKFQNFSTEQKAQESELWHTMSLDIACSFLPSDCPLLNHILLSYQKHHAPSQSQIPENSALDEKLRVIKPHYGIDNSKFQPIIRALSDVKIDLPYSNILPAQKKVTKLLKGIQARHIHAQEKSMALIKQVQGGNSNTPVAQQAPRNNQLSPKKKLSNFQALKLLKLEKIVGKFAKDVGYDKKQILRFLLGDQPPENAAERRKSDAALDGRYPLGTHSGRPQSHKESLSTRQNLEEVNANTGMAAKLAYNNMRKYGEADVMSQNLVANPSQASMKSAASQNWRMSPQSYMESRNGRQFANNDNHFEQERLSAGHGEPASQAVPVRMQGQNQGEKRLYDSESSHRDNSFLHDLSHVQVNHHDKSFNEQLDERSKFVLNQSDMNMELQQHQNFSVGTISNSAGQSHGGTVRQNSKRVHSHERGKVQRPRSSKGYRGAQQANQSQTQAHSHANSNGASNLGGQSMQHQMSAHHLHTGALSSIQNSSSLTANNAPQQKFHTTKSEERALKTQQNQRSLVNKGQRQKTAGATGHGGSSHNTSSHTSHGFNKEPMTSGMQSKKLASLNSQLQSQSSTQLPSAQVTGGLQKLTKKQIQQIQQHHAQQAANGMVQHQSALASAASSSQLQPASMSSNLVQYSSLNTGSKNSKMKMNYDDLKKFLLKEQNSAQVQQILQQHAALGSLNPANSQSQTNFVGVPNQIGHIESGGLLQGQDGGGRGRSQPGAKSKKMAAQSQSQLTAMQALSNQQKLGNVHSAQSLEKLEQIQVSLDEGNNQSINYQTSNNRDIKDLMYTNPDLVKGEGQPGQAHYSTQSKKAKQIIAQARKATGGAGGHQSHIQQSNGQFQQVSAGMAGQPPHQTAQQAQQIYLSSLAPHGQARPNSSHKYSGVNAGNPSRPSHNQLVNHREANSKSALATVGKHSTVGTAPTAQNQAGQNQNQGTSGGNASIKRREKGRLIMQEWLTKSGQNVSSQGQLQSMQAAQNASQHAQLLAAQAAQNAAHNNVHQPASSQHQHGSAPTSKNKFVQKQPIGGFVEFSNSQISLTKQQQQQLQQLQLAKQNMGHGLDRSISQQNSLNVKMTNE